MLTGHGTMQSAMESGRLEAYAYLQKPCEVEELIGVIDAARQDKIPLMQRHEIPHVEKGSAWKWLVGSHNSRPGVILLGLVIFAAITLAPAPERLLRARILSQDRRTERSTSRIRRLREDAHGREHRRVLQPDVPPG